MISVYTVCHSVCIFWTHKAKNKIFLVSPYLTDPLKMARLKKNVHDLKMNYFSFTKIFILQLEKFSVLLCYLFNEYLIFYCKILNTNYFEAF